jgi:magnesium chelatase family protein
MNSHKDVSASQQAVSTVLSRAPEGLQAPLVRVEVHLGQGLPQFALVGLPEVVVRESKERVRSALQTSGFEFPLARITVNLSPADLPKEGGRFDLPIAIGILAAARLISDEALQKREFYGELSLGGELRQTAKLLPALIHGARSGNELILPEANALEASLVRSGRLRLARRLSQVVAALKDGRVGELGATRALIPNRGPAAAIADIAEVRGQFAAKRALEIAAAAEHGLLFIGPPGAGKTLLAQRLPGLLPPLSADEALEVACLESAAGRRPTNGLRRPFRSPQHTASVAALIGGSGLRPGELSLAHRGVLFLDELPEFPRNALEALREPLESGVVVISRQKRTRRFPAQFLLIAAMNPCPCGYAGDARGRCHCTREKIARYRNRISGPLVDRIDMHVELMALPVDHLVEEADSTIENSAAIAVRVAAARNVQLTRQGKLNSRLSAREVAQYCTLGRDSRSLMATAIARMGLSARAYHRVLKLARTCADLAAAPDLRFVDVAEAIKLRALDRPIC